MVFFEEERAKHEQGMVIFSGGRAKHEQEMVVFGGGRAVRSGPKGPGILLALPVSSPYLR